MKNAALHALAAAILLASCSVPSLEFAPGPGVDGEEILEVPVGSAGALTVTTEAGGVEVLPAALPGTVRVVARKHALDAEDLAAIRVFAREEGGVIRVGYDSTGVRHGAGVAFTVEAPPSLALRLRSSAGSVRARGFASGMEARTSAGSIRAEDVRGDLLLETSAGSIEVTGADGAVNAVTGAGSVDVSGRLRGACALESGAGSVTATVPHDARLRMWARTSAGEATSDFLHAGSHNGSGTIMISLGDGEEGTLELRSSAGNVRLRKAP